MVIDLADLNRIIDEQLRNAWDHTDECYNDIELRLERVRTNAQAVARQGTIETLAAAYDRRPKAKDKGHGLPGERVPL